MPTTPHFAGSAVTERIKASVFGALEKELPGLVRNCVKNDDGVAASLRDLIGREEVVTFEHLRIIQHAEGEAFRRKLETELKDDLRRAIAGSRRRVFRMAGLTVRRLVRVTRAVRVCAVCLMLLMILAVMWWATPATVAVLQRNWPATSRLRLESMDSMLEHLGYYRAERKAEVEEVKKFMDGYLTREGDALWILLENPAQPDAPKWFRLVTKE